MEPVAIIVYFILFTIALIPTILSIMLFFKIWGMTNDVRTMTEILKEWLDIEHPVIDEETPKATPKI